MPSIAADTVRRRPVNRQQGRWRHSYPARNAQLPTPNAFALNKRVSRKDNLFRTATFTPLFRALRTVFGLRLTSSNAY